MDVAGRLARLRRSMFDAGSAALLVTDITNIRYLTGFTGSAGVLLVDADGALLVTDGRYRDQAPDEIGRSGSPVDVVIGAPDGTALKERAGRPDRLGLEADSVTWSDQQRIAGWFPDAELVATSGLVEELRQVKDDGELARMAEAAGIADAALAVAVDLLVAGSTERQVATAIDHAMRRLGASDRAFETIVAGGIRSARPHARPGDRPFESGDLVVCDLGAVVDGYRSDMTRSFRIGGTGGGRAAALLHHVLAAQQAGLDAVAEGVPVADVDRACRTVLEDAGLGEAFIHGTGHGVGLDIHEAPAVSSTATGTLRAGQVVTVEPGAYLADLGGVRWEDTVVVTSDGCRPLTGAPKTV